MAGSGNARAGVGAAVMLLLTVFAGGAAGQVPGKEHVILTNSQPNNSLQVSAPSTELAHDSAAHFHLLYVRQNRVGPRAHAR